MRLCSTGCATTAFNSLFLFVASALALLTISCGESPSSVAAIRLVDVFSSDLVEGAPSSAQAQGEALWNADGGLPLSEWKVGAGVTSLAVRDGKLRGRSTSDIPILHARLPEWADPADTVDSIELRMTAGTGKNVGASVASSADADFDAVVQRVGESGMSMESPVADNLGMQSIRIPVLASQKLSGARVLYVRPTDVAGAEFEIESIRLVTRRERLGMIPTGITWQGLGEIYRETIVSRSPETFKIDVEIPTGAWLDLAVGTLEEGAVTFQLWAAPAGSSRGEASVLLRKTITTPQRWEHVAVDLSDYRDREMTLFFGLDVDKERTIGLWGSPVIRTRDAKPDAPEAASAALGAVEPPRNVLLIMADTLRSDHLVFQGYGRETEPNLTQLAANGSVFSDNISTASWTKVATPSIVTSLFPTSHRVADIPDRLPAAADTLAEVYREAGYATLAFSSNSFTGRLTNLHQGYEELHERGSVPEGGSKTSRAYVDRFLDWLERNPETPFFTFLHLTDPHSPFEPRAPYGTLWADPEKRQEHLDQLDKVRPHIQNSRDRSRGLPRRSELLKAGIDADAYLAYEQAWYDGSIRAMDVEIGRLVERMGQLDLLDKTVIVFVADHGEEFHEHDRMFHSHSVYGELTNVPLFFHWPGVIPAGAVIDETVRSVDIMPTVLELSRLRGPEVMQGQSLLPLMAAVQQTDDTDRERLRASAADLGWGPQPAVSENVRERSNDLVATSFISDGWRLIHNNVIPAKDRPEYQLFDHADDPLTLRDVAGEHPEVVERMEEELALWLEQVEAAKLSEAASTEGMSTEELERLRSLGYIQ